MELETSWRWSAVVVRLRPLFGWSVSCCSVDFVIIEPPHRIASFALCAAAVAAVLWCLAMALTAMAVALATCFDGRLPLALLG